MMGYAGMKQPYKKTLYVNLYGGPGTGKSTGAAYIFSMLKMAGIDCEYVQEVAKWDIWKNGEITMSQRELFESQSELLGCLNGKVDVVITDSPILLGIYYCQGKQLVLQSHIKTFYNSMNNLDIFLQRVKPYNPNGRMQTEEEACLIDAHLRKLTTMDNFVTGDEHGYAKVVEMVKRLS